MSLLYLTVVRSADANMTSAITHGISHLVGHVAVGTLADLVLWKPESFGAKPEMVLKSGVIAYSQVSAMGEIIDVSANDLFRWAMQMPLSLPFSPSIRSRCGVQNPVRQR